MQSNVTSLPRINYQDIPIWDTQRGSCCGYLYKKASETSKFSKGKLQKRWFFVKTELSAHENYTLAYYHTPEDSAPRQVYILEGARLSVEENNNSTSDRSFQLTCLDGLRLSVTAETDETYESWLISLEEIIDVATRRGHMQKQRRGAKPINNSNLSPIRQTSYENGNSDSNDYINNNNNKNNNINNQLSRSQTLKDSPKPSNLSEDLNDTPTYNNFNKSNNSNTFNFNGMNNSINNIAAQNPYYSNNNIPISVNSITSRGVKYPKIRLDIDSRSMPPGSTERHQFEEMIVSDIQKILKITDAVEIYSVSPAPGMNWLTIVEFDIRPSEDDLQASLKSNTLDSDTVYEMMESRRWKLLGLFHDLLKDSVSVLYTGFVTCKLDPTYSLNFPGQEDDVEVPLFSTEESILDIMNRYKDVQVPEDFHDHSHFTIYLSFEGQIRPISVPNPLLLRKKYCNIWPFEVKQAIGFMGTMQELWVEPVSLIPKGMPSEISHAIFFEPSARLNGAVAINASRLKPDLIYEVNCEDLRAEVMKSLTDDERQQIKDTFDAYDENGNGSVSMAEMENLIKIRTDERKAAIEEKFQEFASIASDSELQRAEEQKRSYLQQLTESQNKMLKMFAMSDLDGNKELSFTEFMLAESWWLKCSINPDHAHLF